MQFHERADDAGLPRCMLHDLRHRAATLMLASGVPLAVVSKTLRHSKVSITVDLVRSLSQARTERPTRWNSLRSE